jgi:hypothetical protein
MALTLAEQYTQQFYEWERLGRGWYTFDTPVELEPEFIPFFRQTAQSQQFVDDGKRPGILASTKALIQKILSSTKEQQVAEPEPAVEPIRAYTFQSNEAMRGFSVSFPEGEIAKGKQIEQFLVMLSYSRVQISFEIIATNASIRIQFVCRESDVMHVESQLKAYFPTCIIHDQSDTLTEILKDDIAIYMVDFGLKEEFTRPVAMQDRFEVDPLTGLLGTLEHLHEGEQAVLQILFKGTVNPWAASMLSAVTDAKGDSFFLDAPEMPKLAMEKVSSPLYAASIRVVGQSTTDEKAYAISERISMALLQTAYSSSNTLIPLTGYDPELFLSDILWRRSHRTGMILNAKELATFVHYPFTAASKKLERDLRKTKPAPRIAEGHDFILGRNIHQGNERIPTLNTSLRLKHMHVIGATGTGKSTFLQSCIVQDIHLGNGLAVLDPHGDLIESILSYIPEKRYNDVIIVDPSDADYPVGFNILTAHSEVEKEILASDLVSVFRRLSSSFGDQMHSVLANAILAFLESSTGGTLIDLRRFLIEKTYREDFLKTVADPSVVYYWQKEYPLLKTSSIGPILTRLDSFLRPKVIRNMVAQKRSLDFAGILDTQKILFVKLSQGLIGTENSYLLGTFFVSKIYQAAMARQGQSKEERKPFYLYIDEFQNFITPSMSSILSGTRKYGLGCILAHQDMIQLQKVDSELASAVISNAGTRVCFRLGDIDAKRFEDGFASFKANDLQNLGLGQAIIRIERPENDCNISALQLNAPDLSKDTAGNVITLSRQTYGTNREEVEKSLEYLRTTVTYVEKAETKQKPAAEKQEVEEQSKVETDKPPVESIKTDEAQKAKTKEKLIQQKEVSQHRYLQTLIKKMAEARGYKATIEEPIPGGGRVDVVLERNGKRIACEIGVTTTKQWETHNIQKCLEAGYETVIAVPIDGKACISMEKEIEQHLPRKLNKQIFVFEADALFQYLDSELAKDASTETLIKGYRVKVKYAPISQSEMLLKKENITSLLQPKSNPDNK